MPLQRLGWQGGEGGANIFKQLLVNVGLGCNSDGAKIFFKQAALFHLFQRSRQFDCVGLGSFGFSGVEKQKEKEDDNS